jgi:putative DNA primase/helicase
MWRRLKLVPFEQTFSDAVKDPHLLHRLKGEGSGILNWALGGLASIGSRGVIAPPAIERATAAYRTEQDIVSIWIAECCQLGPHLAGDKTNLYSSYRSWALVNGHHPMSSTKLTRILNGRGYVLDAGRRKVVGLDLVAANAHGLGLRVVT